MSAMSTPIGLEPCATALTFRREFWQEIWHESSTPPRPRRGQGRRRRRPALPQWARQQRHRQGRARRRRVLPRCSRRKARSSSISSSPRPSPTTAAASSSIARARWPPTLVEKLNFYKLRAKIAVEDLSDALGVMAVWDGAALSEDGLSYPDPRLPALGTRSILPPQSRRRGRRRTRRDADRCRGL